MFVGSTCKFIPGEHPREQHPREHPAPHPVLGPHHLPRHEGLKPGTVPQPARLQAGASWEAGLLGVTGSKAP